jgi:nucleoside 2-deoxyribosyltransferase
MKLFCAYAFTGEDLDVLTRRMRLIVDTLNEAGHEAYCNRFDTLVDDLQSKDDIKGIFKRAFEVIGENEGVVAIITTPNKSVGQIMEIGVAMSQGKPIYLFEHSSAVGSNYLNKLVDEYYIWENEEDLKGQIAKLKA